MGLLDKPSVTEQLRKEHNNKLEATANSLLKKNKKRRGKKNKKRKKKQKIPLMSYRFYIKSIYWKKRKHAYFSKYKKECAICGKKKGVTLHHKKYKQKLYGKEPDYYFVPLCQKHHHDFHKNFPTGADMIKDTDDYIKTMRQLERSNIDDLGWV